MDSEYMIKVYLSPDKETYPDTPYGWCLLVLHDDWCNEGSGWAKTPELAFKEAYEYFLENCNIENSI